MGTVDAGRLAYIGDASAVAGVPSHGVDSIPSREDHVSYLVPVRFRRGVVAEVQPPAYAGNSSCRGQTEQLAEFCAMPCVACLALATLAVDKTPAL
jgi:hypothetical protein